MKTEQKEEHSSLMESLSLRSIVGRDRERERRTILSRFTTLYTYVCSMNTFIQVLEGLTEVLTVLQCSLRAPTLTPKYIPHRISFLTASRFPHRSGPTYAPVCVPVYALGLTDWSQPIWSSASSADPADVELVSQQVPGLFGIFGLTAPVPPGFTPRSRSSTYSTPRASTLPVGLSAHVALISSSVVAVLTLLLLPFLPLGPR